MADGKLCDSGGPRKPSAGWKVTKVGLPEPKPEAPPLPHPPIIKSLDLSSMHGPATINRKAKKMLERSKQYE